MKGETLIQAYLDVLTERDSYKAQEGEPQTPARESLLKQAEFRLKIAYANLNGSMLGEVRRRLAARVIDNEDLHGPRGGRQ